METEVIGPQTAAHEHFHKASVISDRFPSNPVTGLQWLRQSSRVREERRRVRHREHDQRTLFILYHVDSQTPDALATPPYVVVTLGCGQVRGPIIAKAKGPYRSFVSPSSWVPPPSPVAALLYPLSPLVCMPSSLHPCRNPLHSPVNRPLTP